MVSPVSTTLATQEPTPLLLSTEKPKPDTIVYYEYMHLEYIFCYSTYTYNMYCTNNRILADMHVLTGCSPQHCSILFDLLKFAVISSSHCCDYGRWDTPWSKEMTQQLDGSGGKAAVALEGV
jgi:hypothetical protein